MKPHSGELAQLGEHPDESGGSATGAASQNGELAQLGEHFHGMEGVRGSSPLFSTSLWLWLAGPFGRLPPLEALRHSWGQAPILT